VLPINLSSFYPYPVKNGMDVPVYYYMYLILFALLIAGIFYSLRVTKKIAFSIGFFAVTVFLVLQLLPVGSAIMADRYSYIPSIGIFYLAGEGFNLLWNKKMKWIAITLISIFGSFFLFKTYKRCTVWKNEMSLWDNVINQYQTIPVAYNNRGNAFRNNNKIKEAFEDYSNAIKLNPDYSTAYFNRGSIYMNEQKDAAALSDFNKAIELDPVYVKALSNRSIIYLNTKKYDEALYDLNKAILINSNSEILYNNRGKVLMSKNMFEEAIRDFDKALKLKPDFGTAYNNLGFAFYNIKNYNEAINNYSKAIELKPDFAEAYYYRAFAIYFSGNKDAACKDLNKAASLNYQPAAEALIKNCK